ncbi:MAG: lactate utilization protein [Firmicutes bacterium]|nr:lactate utilization protein [Bacillota bacterium]
MNLEKTIRSLEEKLYTVKVFDTAVQAADYLDSVIDGKVVGFGDSRTMIDMNLYERLSAHNRVYDPNQSVDNDGFLEIAAKTLTTEVFLTSVNGMAETGEMINIDGTGNRVAGSLFGHEKVYFVIGVNKIEPDEERALLRARNTAGPTNALKYDLDTPCVAHFKGTGEKKCFDCKSPDRICNAIVTYKRRMSDIEDVEIILINEEMGF